MRATGVYDDDASVNSRTGLDRRCGYAPDPASRLTFTALLSTYFEDKSGNGDGDYLGYAPALAFGDQLLARYKPSAFPQLAACPTGTFVATNANGQPNGFGPNGKPDGGLTCQTPQQYAAFNTGYDGAGPATQRFDFADQHVAYTRTHASGTFRGRRLHRPLSRRRRPLRGAAVRRRTRPGPADLALRPAARPKPAHRSPTT